MFKYDERQKREMVKKRERNDRMNCKKGKNWVREEGDFSMLIVMTEGKGRQVGKRVMGR